MPEYKAPRKDTAFSERSEFAFDEFRYIPVMFALPDKERFQMSRNHSIQGIFFGIARTVDLLELHEDIAECKLLHIRADNENSKLQRAASEKIPLFRDNIIAFCFGFGDKTGDGSPITTCSP